MPTQPGLLQRAALSLASLLLLGPLAPGLGLRAQTPTPPAKEDKPGLPLKPTRKIEFTTDEGTWMSLVFELLGDLYTLPLAGGQAKPLTTGMAFDCQPRYSPDGRWIAFVSDRDGTENLWVIHPDGTGLRQITKEPNSVFASPAWDPDSRYLFVSRAPFGIGSHEVWMYHLDGGTGVQLTKAKATPATPRREEHNAMGVVASSDGRFLYYAVRKGDFSYNAQFPIWKVVRRDRRTGLEDELVGRFEGAFRPSLSPDGRTLIYATRHETETGLRLRDLVTGEDRWLRYPVTRDDQESLNTRDLFPGLAFLPGGREIVYNQDGRIRRLDLASGREQDIPFTAQVSQDLGPALDFPRKVEQGPVRSRLIMGPAEAPDGKRLAFSALGRLYTLDLPGGEPRRVVKGEGHEFQPAWSPDGTMLAYVTWTAEGGHLWKVASRGGVPVRLSRVPALYSNPVWTPDGARIVVLKGNAYDRDHSLEDNGQMEQADLVWLPAAGGDPTLILPARGAGAPHFTADPDRIFMNTPQGLVSVRMDGSDRRTHLLVKGKGFYHDHEPVPADDVVPSPDGRWVLAQVMNQLYLVPMPVVGGETPVVDVQAGAMPVKRLTDIGADYMAWLDGGKTLGWAIGASWFRQPLAAISLEPPKDEPKGEKAEKKPATFKEQDASVQEIAVKVEVARKTPKGTLVLRGVRAITMKGDEVLDNADVVVQDNRILRVGPRGEVPAGAKVLDLTGKTVLPGFVDTHAHWMEIRRGVLDMQNWSFMANLAYGVTAGLDVQTGTNDMFAYQDLTDAGEIVGLRAFSTGPGVFSNNNFQSVDEVKGVFTRYKKYYGTPNIKSYIVGTRKQRHYLVEAARELEMMPTTEGGLDLKLNLTHVLDGYHGNEHTLPIAPLYKDVIELFARSGIAETPTLIVNYGGPFGEEYFFQNSDFHLDPKLNRFLPHLKIDQSSMRRAGHFRKDQYAFPKFAAQMTKLVRAGGLVGVGSHGEFQGLGFHWELWMLGSGGMTPLEALRCATANGARIIGRPADLGSLEPGKLADLLILDRNPLEDLHNTTSIHWVMKNGELFEGDTLDQVWPEQKPLAPLWFWNHADEPKAGEPLHYGPVGKLP